MKKKSNNIPTWMNTADLVDKASNDLKARNNITVELPSNFKTIASYECNTCRLPFTTGMIEPQIKKAARSAQNYIECPKCSGFLVEKQSVVVRNPDKITSRSVRVVAPREAPIQRGINTWVDKAIYGRLVQSIADFVGTVGIDNPQLRFHRGIRSSKFPGEPMSAKGAEFTCEFTDDSNTRNRIFITGGITPEGRFIYPRTFKTMSGNEYPLTALAIEDFVSGKVYAPTQANYEIPPLNYRQPDYTRFREISATRKRLIKRAFDVSRSQPRSFEDEEIPLKTMDTILPGTGIENPIDYDEQGARDRELGVDMEIDMGMGMDIGEEVSPDAQILAFMDEHPEILKRLMGIAKKAYGPGNPNVVAPLEQGGVPVAMPQDYYSAKMKLEEMGLSEQRNPTQFAEMMKLLEMGEVNTRSDEMSVAQPTQMGNIPNTGSPSGIVPGPFMNGVGLAGRKMADIMNMAPIIDDNKLQVLADIIQKGLTFDEAYVEMRQYGMPLTQQEFDIAGQVITEPNPEMIAASIAEKIMKKAELQHAKHMHVTAEEVVNFHSQDDMTQTESKEWMNSYVDTYNDTIDKGEGTVEAANKAIIAAQSKLAEVRVKFSYRDSKTLFPFTDPDPDYSLAQQTKDSEPRFDMPYNETDGGIPAYEDRNYSVMFKGKVEPPATEERAGSTLRLEKKAANFEAPSKCTSCKKDIPDTSVFKDDASVKEYGISGLCQHCQDNTFKESKNLKSKKAFLDDGMGNPAMDPAMDPEGFPVTDPVMDPQSQFQPFQAEGWEAEYQKILAHVNGDSTNDYVLQARDVIRDASMADTEKANMLQQLQEQAWRSTAITYGEPGLDFEAQTPAGYTYDRASTLKMEKIAEPTGTELSPDEVGQNPINMSRLKTLVQDYIRAGNIPPTKVDLHKLKDGGYTLDELKALVKTIQTKDDAAIYPTTHADIDKVKKQALDTLSDMYKEMPAEKEIIEPQMGLSIPNPVEVQPEFNENELTMGIGVEQEFVDDETLARDFAMEHLRQNPSYYTIMRQMLNDNIIRASRKEVPKDTESLLIRLKADAKKIAMKPEPDEDQAQ